MPTINPNNISLGALFPCSPSASSPRTTAWIAGGRATQEQLPRRGPKNTDALQKTDSLSLHRKTQAGFSLIEMIVFIVVISIALGALLAVYQQSVISSVDPIKRIRMLELAQAQMDRLIRLPYDANTPAGGIPACGSVDAPPCADLNSLVGQDSAVIAFDEDRYSADISVDYNVEQATLEGKATKLITVTVSAGGESLTLSSYRVNF